MTKACLMLTASRVDVEPLNQIAGALQQVTRFYEGDQCTCVLLVTFPPGSPAWDQWMASRALDGMPPMRPHSIQSDVAPML